MPVTVIGYQLKCCYNSSPKLPGVYAHTVRVSIHDIHSTNCYLIIKNTLRAYATMRLTLETTIKVWDTIDTNAILLIRKRKKNYR